MTQLSKDKYVLAVYGSTRINYAFPACVHTQETVLFHLIRRGVEMTTKDNEGLTPLDIAKKSESKECVQLIQKSQEPEETSDNEDKGPNEEKLEVEVHESTKTSGDHKEEENKNEKSQGTDEQDKVDDSVGENLEEEAPPTQKKKKRSISFLLPGDQEPVPIASSEQEECEDIIPQDDDIVVKMENAEQTEAITINDLEVQLPEPTVSRHACRKVCT